MNHQKQKNKIILPLKGKIIYVSIKSSEIQDKRFFTNATKLKKYLNFVVKNTSNIKIRFKEIRIN